MQQLNLVGLIFFITQDALAQFKAYRQALQAYFMQLPDGDEILTDIEHRIAEIFWESTRQNKIPINGHIVQAMIAQVGKVEDFMEAEQNPAYESLWEEENALPARAPLPEREAVVLPIRSKLSFAPYSEEVWEVAIHRKPLKKKKQKEEPEPDPHRFYRDSKRGMIGGVCAGVAHYFQVDVVWVRLIGLLIACLPIAVSASSLSSIYGIMWVFLPESSRLPDVKLRKRLLRDLRRGKIGGVCAGLARYFGWDEKRLRIIFALSSIFGLGALVYAICWGIIPKEKIEISIWDELEISNA